MVTLAAMVGWILILLRLPHVRLASPPAKFSLSTLVFFTLAATFSIPTLATGLDAITQLPGTSLIAINTFAVLAAAMWAISCVLFEPSVRSRAWLIKLAPVIWLALLAVWYLFLPEMRRANAVEMSSGGLMLTALVHSYSFAVIVTIALPGLARRISREQAPPIRIRLGAILATQIILGIWLGSRMTLSPMILLGILPRTFSFGFINVLIGLMILAYAASLLPPSALILFVKAAERLWQWRTLYSARRIERHISRLLRRPSVALPASEIVATPDYALYRVIIAILDRRKALRQAASPLARHLAWQLDEMTTRSTSYPELLANLHKVKLRGS